ncbi:N-acyl-D-amino-acid deacylase family protein [Natronorubrum tibetense]|uniref:N-acyl-D-glutamate deacylase n=1 Tax=Natronorubrum tibetense GA33 TaxID=1114856 RepID=L9VNE3_9EURY|nr:D-aminoacylase [Natronorubrum tibetense]ELY37778.1 N-acyl-D-glutamate deacylase [Natronorubrum tibetense GA33]
MTDLLITNARIVDGTGAPWFAGSVAVDDGKIVAVRRETAPDADGETTIDADGRVLCPGFVDTHSHSDMRLFEEPTLEPKIRQGITTEILGQDGFSMAPMYREGGAAEWSAQLSALAGQVDVNWTWGSVADYLDAVEENGIAPNVALFVGHGTVRFNLLGMSDRDPTDDELAEMRDLVSEALDDGALGLSTGLIYTPCTYADRREVQELAAALEQYGRPFVAHVRSEGRWIWDALDEFIDIGAEESVPLHVSHFKVAGLGQQGKASRATTLIETARDRNVDITVEQYPYAAASTMLSAVLPPWVHADGPEQTLEHLADEGTRERIRRDVEEWRIEGWENIGALTGWDGVVISDVRTDANADLEGKSVATIAEERDTDPVDAVCRVLREEELAVSAVYHMMDEADVREILTYERTCVGTDGLFGGKPHPRVYGSYPRILGQYVREENLLTLGEAVRKMTSLPARAMGLPRKGLVRPGMDADLVVFDPVRVGSEATYENPRRYPNGIDHVLVDGEPVVHDGEVTGATPGRAIRGDE